ncbi:MAG: triphosphoribosyl-dephospho-CoA synthase [Mariniblastus sp.]|nr:triphosphoribosyl-dephospho-CoA synthase [Mariniblastus sp.]
MSVAEILTPGRLASTACLLEVCAPKPGNVHRGADFEDLVFEDFVVSAELLGAVIDRESELTLGELILQVVRTTRQCVGTNTNLGLALLLCPLARCLRAGDRQDSSGIARVLRDLGEGDSAAIYEAIRLAQPGGMRPVAVSDIDGPAPPDILEAMALAADRDLVARQYRDNYRTVFDEVVPALLTGRLKFNNLREAIVYAHVFILSRYGDSLIARKCGEETSLQAQGLARLAVEAVENGGESYARALGDLDFWLRSDGHRRNPGTTADLIAAGLMVALGNGDLALPWGGTTQWQAEASGRTE